MNKFTLLDVKLTFHYTALICCHTVNGTDEMGNVQSWVIWYTTAWAARATMTQTNGVLQLNNLLID